MAVTLIGVRSTRGRLTKENNRTLSLFVNLEYALLPHLKITKLLLEVDDWTGFSRHFTHIRSTEGAPDRSLLLTAILADALNLGLRKMAESCPGTSYARLSWLQAWHIRDETYTAALADRDCLTGGNQVLRAGDTAPQSLP